MRSLPIFHSPTTLETCSVGVKLSLCGRAFLLRPLIRCLQEPAILYNLRRRFLNESPYTYTGDICIAVSPHTCL